MPELRFQEPIPIKEIQKCYRYEHDMKRMVLQSFIFLFPGRIR